MPSPIFFTLQVFYTQERSGASGGLSCNGSTGTSPRSLVMAEYVEIVPLPLRISFGFAPLACLAVTGQTPCWSPVSARECHSVQSDPHTRATGRAMVPAGFEILRRVTGDALGEAREHLLYIEIGMCHETTPAAGLKSSSPRTPNPSSLRAHQGLGGWRYRVPQRRHKAGRAGRAAPNVEIVICDETG